MGGDSRVYSKSAEDTIVAFNTTATVLSFLGASFVIWNYWKFQTLRTFAFKLIFFVAVGDMINCIGNFMGSPGGKDQRGLCFTQAFFLQYGDLISFFWVTSIAWIIHRVLTSEEVITADMAELWFKRLHMSIWPTALVLSLLPFIGNTYGPAGGFCWIKDSELGEVWRWISFYVPLWLCIGYMIYIYASVWSQINITANAASQQSSGNPPKVHRNPSDLEEDSNLPSTNGGIDGRPTSGSNVRTANSNSDITPQRNESDYEIQHQSTGGVINESTTNVAKTASDASDAHGSGGSSSSSSSGSGSGSTLNRIKYYPVILFCCYFFATVRRLYEIISGDHAPVVLVIFQASTTSLLGFGNALAYGLTPAVRDTDKAYFEELLGISRSTQSQIRLTSNEDAELESEIR